MNLYIYLYLFLEILAIASVVKAIMETRTAQGAIAWSIFLLTFPLLALPMYWIFGRSRFVGYKTLKDTTEKKVLSKIKTLHQNLERYIHNDFTQGIDIVQKKIAVIGALKNNKTSLLIDGEKSFASILDGMSGAKEYILFQFFIIKEGILASKIQTMLMKKAKEGVRIYLLYDEIGSHALSDDFLRPLQDAGVHISAFNSTKGLFNRFQLNFRNHRKVVVVDGKECWIGGHNVGDEYINKSDRFSHWRDTHITIKGPAVIAAQLSFVEDWYWAQEYFIEELRWQPSCSDAARTPVLILPSGPADCFETVKLFFVDLISGAKERIWIASPYFVPDDATMSALQLAALRGVDVRILIPDQPDHLLVYMAAFSYFEDATIAGVEFYRYTKGFMHQKVVLVDDETAVVGTANFDNRSFRLNFEISAVVYEEAFCKEVFSMLQEDFASSKRMQSDELQKRSFLFMFMAKVARLSAPIL